MRPRFVAGRGMLAAFAVVTVLGTSVAVAAPAWSATASPALSAAPATTASFVVNSVGDGADATINGVCLTAAGGARCGPRYQEANAAAGPVSISFAIPGTGVHTITPATQLPILSNPNGITIDGFTQAGSSPNTDPLVDNTVYGIELKGTNPAGFDGLYITGSNNLVPGLDIHGFQVGIDMYGTTATHNTVEGDMLGLTPTGAFDPTYGLVNNASCLVLESGASYNQIGSAGSREPQRRVGLRLQGHRHVQLSDELQHDPEQHRWSRPNGYAAGAPRSRTVSTSPAVPSTPSVGGDGVPAGQPGVG